MCGLAGFLQPDGLCAATAARTLEDFATSLRHRGPDDAGYWMDAQAGIAFAHRRLAILDLSAAGHQPMTSASGRYVLVFNGEIYNHEGMRRQLESERSAPAWRGHSDTETLVSAVDCWGLEKVLERSVGMFALALWDRREQALTLARDRLGEKPLYYGWHGDAFLFASELKALRQHPEFRRKIDRGVLAQYMRHAYIPAPCSIYADTFKLPPGTYLRLGRRMSRGTLPKPREYWRLREAAVRGLRQPYTGSAVEAVEGLESRLRRAVSIQRIADVPLGAFLSGGVDSTTIVALMQQESPRPVKTFTIGFRESGYDEAEHAKAVARCLGTDHTELYLTPRDAMDVIPILPVLYDEPFGDSSAIPTFLVSRLARGCVKVALSGDGGDELFGGYRRYRRTRSSWTALHLVPYSVRSLLAPVVSAAGRAGGSSALGWRSRRLAQYLRARTGAHCYDIQVSQRSDEKALVLGSTGGQVLAAGGSDLRLDRGELCDTMMFRDAMTYLPDDILVKVDRASMGVSLEVRVPLLDHRVVEFAWCLPQSLKSRGAEGKWILREVLRKYLPEALMQRPKQGFSLPVSQWLRGPLRDWAENLLSEQRLRREEFLNPKIVRRDWLRHLKGNPAGGDALWAILMFQGWLESVTAR